jgi:Sec-independent protein translocase protein TatA
MFGLDTVVVLLIVLAVVLVWRGPKTLPKWGQTLGRGVKAARKEADELRRDAGGTDVADDADDADVTDVTDVTDVANGAPKP